MSPRKQIVDVLARLLVEAGVEAAKMIQSPNGVSEAHVVEMDSTRQEPRGNSMPPPARTGAQPNPNLPPFGLPAPLDLPPVAPKNSLPAPPQQTGPRPRGRPRKDGTNRPPLFPPVKQPQPENPESENDDE